MINKKFRLLFFLSLISLTLQLNYQKIVHNIDPEARCLDGTPGLLYVHEGGDPDHILIFLSGGGTCGQQTLQQTLQSCYERSKTILGSSTPWPDQFEPESVQGYLSIDPKVNRFANWTKFILGYCDGSLHQGFSKDPLKYKEAQLYFRGSTITRSHFDWIQSKYNLKGAEKVVLTGASAGGMGVNYWSNYLKDYVADGNKVYPISDSGALMNFRSVFGDLKAQKEAQNLFKIANKQELTPNQDCNKLFKGTEWKCLFIEYLYPSIKGKFMIINSQYDAYAIPMVVGIDCLKEGISGMTLSGCSKIQLAYIQKYREYYRNVLVNFFDLNQEFSIWTIACSNHVYANTNLFYDSPQQKIPNFTGDTVRNAVESFVFEGARVVSYDDSGWPSNQGCAK